MDVVQSYPGCHAYSWYQGKTHITSYAAEHSLLLIIIALSMYCIQKRSTVNTTHVTKDVQMDNWVTSSHGSKSSME